MRKVCIYHAGCPDGFGAAWAAWQAWGEEAFYVARGHDDPLPAADYAGDFVLFADIAPPAHAWGDLIEQAERLVVLGFLGEVLAKLPLGGVSEKVTRVIEEKLALHG